MRRTYEGKNKKCLNKMNKVNKMFFEMNFGLKRNQGREKGCCRAKKSKEEQRRERKTKKIRNDLNLLFITFLLPLQTIHSNFLTHIRHHQPPLPNPTTRNHPIHLLFMINFSKALQLPPPNSPPRKPPKFNF